VFAGEAAEVELRDTTPHRGNFRDWRQESHDSHLPRLRFVCVVAGLEQPQWLEGLDCLRAFLRSAETTTLA